MSERLYPVVEIFHSRQGEGYNTGLDAVFLRLGGCNLECGWCDTEWRKFESLSLAEISGRIASYGAGSVIVTGGEPTIQPGLVELLEELKGCGYWVALESNGLQRLDGRVAELLDYVAISPKVCYAERYKLGEMVRVANEVRVVAEEGVVEFCGWLGEVVEAERYYLSPCDRERGEGECSVFSVQCSDGEGERGEGECSVFSVQSSDGGRGEGYREVLKALGDLNSVVGGRHWELSVQAHKLAWIE